MKITSGIYQRAEGQSQLRGSTLLLITFFTLSCATVDTVPIRSAHDSSDWTAYAGNGTGQRYSPLRQISRSNVATLKEAWQFHTGEKLDGPLAAKAAFETTPIFVERLLYLSTPTSRVFAVDPKTGTRIWSYDPEVDLSRRYSEVTSRGVSTWLNTKAAVGQPCRRTIYVATLDARLIALDALTGRTCRGFGNDGTVDLRSGVGETRRGEYQVTSPAAVLDDRIIVGSTIGDNGAAELESGVVRAFDARTGALIWSWDPINNRKALRTGAANAWAPISVDPARGLVFVPTSSPSPDYYGGLRHGDNRNANSVVALRSEDGSLAWAFQVVHHDLWDYDVASQPMLITVTMDGRRRDAVAVGTKMGHVFVLDRDSGAPLFPVEERAVPASDVDGESAFPTQPFPSFPPPIVPQSLRPEDAWGLTEADRKGCREKIASLRSEGIFTPPSVQGSLIVPGNVGGMHWGGMAWDPQREILVTNTNRLPFEVRLIPRARYEQELEKSKKNRVGGEYAAMSGTPYALYRVPLFSASSLPCSAPPWGALTAIDFKQKRVSWDVPLGFMPALSAVPGHEMFGSFNLGGALVTNGMVFVAATLDPHLRAFDIESGRLLWHAQLPVPAQASPMTFSIDGVQYVVIASGGHGRLNTPLNDTVVAFRLP